MVVGNYRRGRYAAALAAIAVSLAAQQRPDSSVRRASRQPPKTILIVADVSTDTYQHDSISHALSTIEDLGLRAGIYDTVIRTDVQLVTKGTIAAATGTLTFYKNLDDFDAVVWLASGEPALTSEQKQDLLSSVREGKGFVVIHSGIGASPSWPEFAEMIGGRTLEQPDHIKDFDVSVDTPDFPAMRFFSKSFRVRDVLSPVVLSQSWGKCECWPTREGFLSYGSKTTVKVGSLHPNWGTRTQFGTVGTFEKWSWRQSAGPCVRPHDPVPIAAAESDEIN